MNVDGMLPFENMIADYVKETNNHVLYRVTPIFEGNNLLATGVLMEAYSMEDKGEGVKFNVFCYNCQPDVSIDYANGNSSYIGGESAHPATESPKTEPPKTEPPQHNDEPQNEFTYVLNTNTGKFHYPSCFSAKKIADKNRSEYTGSRDDLIAQGYSLCSNCHP